MNFLVSLSVVFLTFILGLLVTVYICDRLGIGKKPVSPAALPLSRESAQMEIDIAVDFAKRVMLPWLQENYSSCDLVLFHSVPQILPQDGVSPVLYQEGKGLCYQYQLERRAHIGGSLNEGLTSIYSVYPLEKIVQKLNGVLSNYAISAGYPSCEIIYAQNLENGKIHLVIGKKVGKM